MAARIHDFPALRSDHAKALVLQPQSLVDRSLTALGFRHPPLLFDQPFAISPMGLTLRFGFLLLDRKFAAQDATLLLGLLLLHRAPLPLKLDLLLRVALLVLKLAHLHLVVSEASVFHSLALSFLLFQKLLLMLSRRRLLLIDRLFLGLLMEMLLLLQRLLLLLTLL
jgi:hypothetical protein